jgi:hypothetical protein
MKLFSDLKFMSRSPLHSSDTATHTLSRTSDPRVIVGQVVPDHDFPCPLMEHPFPSPMSTARPWSRPILITLFNIKRFILSENQTKRSEDQKLYKIKLDTSWIIDLSLTSSLQHVMLQEHSGASQKRSTRHTSSPMFALSLASCSSRVLMFSLSWWPYVPIRSWTDVSSPTPIVSRLPLSSTRSVPSL